MSEFLNHIKKNILVVEDCVSTQNLFKKFLKLKGFRIVGSAENGYEAIEKYKSLIKNPDDKPDLILMDHHMPLKTGIEAIKEIKKINGNVKNILRSGDIHIKEEALANGVIDFIEKPYKIEDVIKSINNALAS